MARRIKDSNLEFRADRANLKAGKRHYRKIEQGVDLFYYRPKGRRGKPAGAGNWGERRYRGKPKGSRGSPYSLQIIAIADDLSDSDGTVILSYWQAVDEVRKRMVVRAHPADGPVPTVRTTIVEYVADRDARETRRKGRAVRSDAHRLARYVIGREQRGKRKAIGPTKLADIELRALDEDALRKWRDTLPASMKESSRRRTINDLRAALNVGYERHRKELEPSLPAIIKHGLKANGNDYDQAELQERDNQILDDPKVTQLLRATKEVDAEQDWNGDLYRLIIVLAATGTRFSQAARLRVGDCQIERQRLLVPKSRKGRGKSGSTPVPVGQDVIDALLPAVTGRASTAPLLERWRHIQRVGNQWERAGRAAWQSSSEFDDAWDAIRSCVKMPDVIPYALRHSSIVRGLKANLPIRLVAALHDTSAAMIERHYSKWIVDGLEDLAAQALVPLLPRERGGRVLPLRRARHRRKKKARTWLRPG
jgi:integrase